MVVKKTSRSHIFTLGLHIEISIATLLFFLLRCQPTWHRGCIRFHHYKRLRFPLTCKIFSISDNYLITNGHCNAISAISRAWGIRRSRLLFELPESILVILTELITPFRSMTDISTFIGVFFIVFVWRENVLLRTVVIFIFIATFCIIGC